jgi:hypothetical protein
MRGAGVRLENNEFEWNDWSAVTTVPCWPENAADADSLHDMDLDACDPTRKYGGGAFALIPGGGTVENPTVVRRNTIAHIGPSAGISISKNTIAELNHMYDNKDIQLDGALIQGGAHDRYESGIMSVAGTSGVAMVHVV